MNKWLYISLAGFVGAILLVVSFGCTIPRTESTGTTGDIDEFSPPPAAQVESSAVIRIAPSTQQVNAGDATVIEIWVDDVIDLMGVDIELQFNPAILQVQDFDTGKEGIQIEPGYFLLPDFVVNNSADNQTGVINYAISQLDPTVPASGSGLLAKTTFLPVAPGASSLDFIKTQLVITINDTAQEITVTPQAGQIIVDPTNGLPTPTSVSSATVAPTATPIESPTATVPPPPATATLPPPPPAPTATPIVLADVPPLHIPPGATYGFCYRVQSGDTLYSIGQQFGIDPHFINLANDLNPPGHVFPQQALFVPQQYGQGPNVYAVQFGDTLAGIADACHLPVDFLAQVNMLNQDDLLTLPAGKLVVLADGSTIMLPEDTIRIETLIIPIPPFAPPSRYQYPGSVQPPVSPPGCQTWPCP